MSEGAAAELMPWATRRTVAIEGVRFTLYRADPRRRRRTTPALLLHGVPQTAVCWRDLVAELAADRVVLAPDLKGLGGSEAVGTYDLPTLAREMAALVRHEVDGPVDVVGHDWGGTLALALAGAGYAAWRRGIGTLTGSGVGRVSAGRPESSRWPTNPHPSATAPPTASSRKWLAVATITNSVIIG